MYASRFTTILILLLSLSLIAMISITKANAEETITVNQPSSSVTLTVHTVFQENVTGLSNANLSLDSSNSSQPQVVKSFQTAIHKLVPGATVEPTTFKLNTTVRQQHQNSSTWIISENLTLTVDGAASNKPGVSTYDLSFVAMNMSDSLRFNGFEFNNIGPAYLLGPIDSSPSTTTFYLDRALVRGGPYLNPVIPGLTTQSFSLLDFSWIPKISTWTNTYKPLDNSSTWTLSPLKDRPGLPYNLTMGLKSPEGTILFVKVAYYNLDLQLTAPARASANGSTVSFGVPSSTDFVMSTIIAAIVVVAAATFIAERRLVRPMGQLKKKKRKAQ